MPEKITQNKPEEREKKEAEKIPFTQADINPQKKIEDFELDEDFLNRFRGQKDLEEIIHEGYEEETREISGENTQEQPGKKETKREKFPFSKSEIQEPSKIETPMGDISPESMEFAQKVLQEEIDKLTLIQKEKGEQLDDLKELEEIKNKINKDQKFTEDESVLLLTMFQLREDEFRKLAEQIDREEKPQKELLDKREEHKKLAKTMVEIYGVLKPGEKIYKDAEQEFITSQGRDEKEAKEKFLAETKTVADRITKDNSFRQGFANEILSQNLSKEEMELLLKNKEISVNGISLEPYEIFSLLAGGHKIEEIRAMEKSKWLGMFYAQTIISGKKVSIAEYIRSLSPVIEEKIAEKAKQQMESEWEAKKRREIGSIISKKIEEAVSSAGETFLEKEENRPVSPLESKTEAVVQKEFISEESKTLIKKEFEKEISRLDLNDPKTKNKTENLKIISDEIEKLNPSARICGIAFELFYRKLEKARELYNKGDGKKYETELKNLSKIVRELANQIYKKDIWKEARKELKEKKDKLKKALKVEEREYYEEALKQLLKEEKEKLLKKGELKFGRVAFDIPGIILLLTKYGYNMEDIKKVKLAKGKKGVVVINNQEISVKDFNSQKSEFEKQVKENIEFRFVRKAEQIKIRKIKEELEKKFKK